MDIDKLEAGRELDALVAEWIESKPCIVHSATIIIAREMSGETTYSDRRGWIQTCNYGTGDVPVWLPRPFSSKMTAAWDLVMELSSQGFLICLFDELGYEVLESGHVVRMWRCEFMDEGAHAQELSREEIWKGIEQADTAMLAICHAALNAIA